MVRAAIYARISSDRDGDQLGVRRQVEDCERLIARKGWEVAERYVDLSTHDGQLLARILGAVGKKESDDKSRRITRKHQELAQAGRIAGGGTRPYGYEADRRTIRPSEAVVIRELADRVLAGEAIRALCRDLDEREIETVTGKTWSPQTLTRMLTSGRISCQREHRHELVAKAEWPGVIPPPHTA